MQVLAAWCTEGKLRGVSAASLHPREVDLVAVASEAKIKVRSASSKYFCRLRILI